MRTVSLGLLSAGKPDEGTAIAKAQFDRADNMTDRQGALSILVSLDGPEREQALKAFYQQFENDPLVIDKWFALQAMSQRSDTLDQVEKLAEHPAFTLQNPNRLRSLIGSFGANHWVFNDASGRGYRFLADMIIASDKLKSADGGKDGAAARPLAPAGATAFRADADGVETGCWYARPVARRLRAGEQEPVLIAWLGGLAVSDPVRDF